jgi:hypothetical protein
MSSRLTVGRITFSSEPAGVPWDALDAMHKRYAIPYGQPPGTFTVKQYIAKYPELHRLTAMRILNQLVSDGELACSKAVVDGRPVNVYKMTAVPTESPKKKGKR